MMRIHSQRYFRPFQIVTREIQIVDHLNQFPLFLVIGPQIVGRREIGQRTVGSGAMLLADRVGKSPFVQVSFAVDPGRLTGQ